MSTTTPRGFTIWMTGLSGAGKSTLARELEAALRERQRHVEVLDGDEVRENLSKGLGFSKEDRDTNIRRIAYVARLISRSGGVAITAAISPYRSVRDEARGQIGNFVEVFVRCPLDRLVQRDTKGLYAKALRGEIAQFTGISDPYEEPLAAEVVVDTDVETVQESTDKILRKLEALGYLPQVDGQIAPHGGTLVNRLATPVQATALQDRLFLLPRLRLSARVLSDLDMIAVGAFSPLEGFLGQADYESVVARMRLANGLPWSIPITLSATEAEADALHNASEAGQSPSSNAMCWATSSRRMRSIPSGRGMRLPSANGSPSSASRRATRSTVRTSTCRSQHSRSSMASCFIHSWAKRRTTISRPRCACVAIACCSTATTRPSGSC